ncbi:SRPBCC family protein [Mycobacterium sp. NPDC003323]
MRLVNEFTVDASLDSAWAILTDIPRMASCIPGAEIESVDGADFVGKVAVKVGPVGLTLQGQATLVGQDDAAHTMVVRGAARDRKGQGSAEATISIAAHEESGRTVVVVTTDLDLGGKIAQFGSGVISQVSNRIIKQFVGRLNSLIAAEESAGGGTPGGMPAVGALPARGGIALPPSRFAHLGVTALAGVALGLAVGRAVYAIR